MATKYQGAVRIVEDKKHNDHYFKAGEMNLFLRYQNAIRNKEFTSIWVRSEIQRSELEAELNHLGALTN
ncbi:hypothetical protein CMI41_00220 [Candidatus Pacearchaeota archaeon]|nr:hypothetical protein [Candidatus Pacearchaeota archaeon]|tara:strand:- start:20948 stop:21154 length:207 start_codon:yes stop_codon:yes gene_type:complete